MPKKYIQTIIAVIAGIAFAVFAFSCCNVPGAHSSALDTHDMPMGQESACCHIHQGSPLVALHNPDISLSAGNMLLFFIISAVSSIAFIPVAYAYTQNILRLLLYKLWVRRRQGSSKLFNWLIGLFRAGLLNPKTF